MATEREWRLWLDLADRRRLQREHKHLRARICELEVHMDALTRRNSELETLGERIRAAFEAITAEEVS